MVASSVTGIGQGSADKAGQKGSEHLWVGVERIVGPRVIAANVVTLVSGGANVTFPVPLPGVATDYIVLATAINAAAHAVAVSAITVNGFTVVGTGTDVVQYCVVRTNTATVQTN